jgi:hypothetical protein
VLSLYIASWFLTCGTTLQSSVSSQFTTLTRTQWPAHHPRYEYPFFLFAGDVNSDMDQSNRCKAVRLQP